MVDDKPEGKGSTAQVTREYVEGRPALRKLLMQGLVNHSALARQIMDEEGLSNEEAVTAALRRHVHDLGKTSAGWDEAIMKLLSESSLNMKNKIAIITAKSEWLILARLEKLFKGLLGQRVLLQVILGTEGLTIITEERMKDAIIDALGKEYLIKTKSGLAEVAVRCPVKIEDTPGVVTYLSSMLAQRGMNVLEMVSCYTDVIFIVEEKDGMKAYDILAKSLHR